MTSPKGKHYNAVRRLTLAGDVGMIIGVIGALISAGMYELTPLKDIAFKCFAGSAITGSVGAGSFLTAQVLSAR